MDINPTSASFLVTEDCNLRCTYCFEKHKKNRMSIDVARRGIEFLCENAKKNGSKQFSAMIFGGEPLLEPDIIKEIWDRGIVLARENNMEFVSNIVTNATVMNDKVYNLIKDYKNKVNLEIQLSVDGIKEIHDMYRITRDGKGSFELVEKNIPIFKELFNDNLVKLSIHGCINKKSLPYLYENYDFFRHTWGFERVWFIPVMEESWDENDVEIYDKENEKIYDDIISITKKTKDIKVVQNYAPMDRCLRFGQRSIAPCGAGKNFVTITANGEIYPCHQIYFNDPNKETKIGHIWNGINNAKRRIYLDYDYTDLSCPDDCEHTLCYRCIAVNRMVNGSILKTIKGFYCEMSKVDFKYQKQLRKVLKQMGLIKTNNQNINNNIGNNPANPACLCDARGNGGCDVVAQNGGNNPSNPDCLCDSRGYDNNDLVISKDGCGCDKKEGCNNTNQENELLIESLKTLINETLDTKKLLNIIQSQIKIVEEKVNICINSK